ncbi:hypothetical protein HYPGJ_30264 [Hyphomicrobium sp. GJ21]|nr:hypothetical protein HYPGJ_30264 [Hyphomicrobium sp. GJ21]
MMPAKCLPNIARKNRRDEIAAGGSTVAKSKKATALTARTGVSSKNQAPLRIELDR